MKKFLLSMAAIIMAAISANAQITSTKKADVGILQQNPYPTSLVPRGFKAPANRIVLEDNQLIMGPYTTDQVASSSQGLGVTGVPGILGAYVYLPYDAISPFDGSQVVKMRVGLAAATTISQVYILPVQNGNIMNPIVSQSVNSNKAGWNEFTLNAPVTLNLEGYDGVLMGFDYRQTSSNYPLSCVNAGSEAYDLYIYGNLGSGTGYYYLGNSYGNLSVQAIVEGEFPEHKAMPQPMGDFAVTFGSTTNMSFMLKNLGTANIENVDYVLDIDGEVTEHHVDMNSPLPFGSQSDVRVDFPSADTEKTQNYSITVTKVNGADNAQLNATISGLFASTTMSFPHRVAVEEFTGLGCMWCPRGIVGMEMMREKYGDQLVQVAIHQYSNQDRDAMNIADDSYADLNFDGAPECSIDRIGLVDPYYGASDANFGISQILDALLMQTRHAQVTVSADWNADSTQVVAKATVEQPIDGAQYDLEFVLIGDGLKGTGTKWTQTNAYYQYTVAQIGSDDLAPFCKGGEYGRSSVSGLTYNDVALASSYVGGVNQVARQTYSAGETEVEYTLTMPTYAALKNAIDTHQVYAAALLIDISNGQVLNCAKVQLPYFGQEQPVLDLTIDHERQTGLGYTPTEAQVDFTEAKAFLGVDALSTNMLYIEKPNGERILFNADNSAADGYDGWFDGEGNPTKWGANTKVCVKFFEALTNNGTFTFYDMNNADEVGKTYTVKWVLVNGEKAVRYTINVTFVGLPEYKPEIIATIDVPVQMKPATAYEGKTATFPVDEIVSALGITSITEAAQYIVNVSDGNFVVNGTDGWRDANGDACGWGDLYNKAPGVCVKINDPASGIIDYMGAIDESYQEGDTYVAKWGFVNSDEKAAVLNVNITFTDGPATGISNVESSTFNVQPIIFNLSGQQVKNAQKGIFIQNGKKKVIK